MNSMVNLWLPAFSMPGSGGRVALARLPAPRPGKPSRLSVACIDLSNFRLLNKLLGPGGWRPDAPGRCSHTQGRWPASLVPHLR